MTTKENHNRCFYTLQEEGIRKGILQIFPFEYIPNTEHIISLECDLKFIMSNFSAFK
jgi:hypothetical protein